MSVDRLGAPFRRLGVAATWRPADYTAGGAGTVMLDAPDTEILGGAIQSTEYSVLYRASELVGLAVGDTLEIGGVCYTVRHIEAVDDGALMRARLSKDA